MARPLSTASEPLDALATGAPTGRGRRPLDTPGIWGRIADVTVGFGAMFAAGMLTCGQSKAALEALSAMIMKDFDGRASPSMSWCGRMPTPR